MKTVRCRTFLYLGSSSILSVSFGSIWFIYHYLLLIFILWWWVIFSLKNWKRKNYVLYTVEILLFVILAKVKILVPTFICIVFYLFYEEKKIRSAQNSNRRIASRRGGRLEIVMKIVKIGETFETCVVASRPRDCAICDDCVFRNAPSQQEGDRGKMAAAEAQPPEHSKIVIFLFFYCCHRSCMDRFVPRPGYWDFDIKLSNAFRMEVIL